MSMQLKIDHVDGLRLRHQVAHKVDRKEGDVQAGTEWRFDEEVPRDTDPRKRDANGAPLILPSYTFYVAYGLKNVVIEKKGKAENLTFRNSSLRNQLRIKIQALTETGKKDKTGVALKEWRDQQSPQYIPANQWTGVCVGDGLRAIVDEMAT